MAVSRDGRAVLMRACVRACVRACRVTCCFACLPAARFKGYMSSLGLTRTAQIKCQARIGEAQARMDATIRVRARVAAAARHAA